MAIYFCRQAVLRIEELRMHSVCASSSRHQIQQILEIAVIPQGEIDHLLAFNLGADIGSVRLEYRSFSIHHHAFGYGSRLKRKVHARVCVHNYIHCGSHYFLESLFLGSDFILTWGKIGKCIIPAIISRRATAKTRLRFCSGDLCLRHRRARGVRHRAKQCCVDRLTHDRRGEPCE